MFGGGGVVIFSFFFLGGFSDHFFSSDIQILVYKTKNVSFSSLDNECSCFFSTFFIMSFPYMWLMNTAKTSKLQFT